MADLKILKADGAEERFDKAKLEDSLRRTGADEELVKKVSEHIERDISTMASDATAGGSGKQVTTSDIYEHAFDLLKEAHRPSAARYSLRRALIGFGPTGFPFEKFIAEIFKADGYETLNDQMLAGKCVEHEVDVVAWNAKKLIVSEVKFHNELGLKSDLKTALYVKARMDDLESQTFSFGLKEGGKGRKIDEGWLITNTKFSTQAIKYGECVGLEMLGWNYPKGNTLEDKIVAAGLHPLSCLTSLSVAHKQELYARKVVLCRDLSKDPSLLESLHLSPEKLAEVKEESTMLCGC